MSIQLSSEIEARLRAEAAALGVSVDELITNALQAYLRNGTGAMSNRISSRDRSAEMAWAANPDIRFAGKWVVLEGNQVEASGSDPRKLYEEVTAKGDSSPFLIFVSPDEQQPFAGGWLD